MPRLPLLLIILACISLLHGSVHADEASDPSAKADQLGWTTINLPGATCGTGAPYEYYLSRSQPDKPLMIYLEGGGSCVKDGPAPTGTTGVAAALYCMNYGNFEAPSSALLNSYGIFSRGLADNQFKDFNFAFMPYCTGDLHSGTETQPHDYDPRPDAEFNVVHRGHLNILAALNSLATQFPMTTTVMLTGSSAGGLGALYNFPSVVERWPSTRVVSDAGTLPSVPKSLVQQTLALDTPPWTPRPILPAYCNSLDCVRSSTRLLAAHANHYDGTNAPWKPFGLLQSQQDHDLSNHMEITRCEYQLALRTTLDNELPSNLRYFVPATYVHTFFPAPPFFPIEGYGTYRHSINGVTVMAWTAQLIQAPNLDSLPRSQVDPWPPCAALFLPGLTRGVSLGTIIE